jgi:hypothetical protein
MKRLAATGLMLGCALLSLAAAPQSDIRLSDLQFIGTHNSYHIEPDQAIDLAMLATRYAENDKWTAPRLVRALAYSRPPLSAQLSMGLRLFELDLHDDPDGGRFADPGVFHALAALKLMPDEPFDPAPLRRPGFKTFHSVDTDVRSTCPVFADCLREIRDWSDAHPGHLPIFIQLETKQASKPAIGGRYVPAPDAPFDAGAWRRLQTEILSVFPAERLITPAVVQGASPSLNAAVRERGWPTVAASRGKIVFLLLDDDPVEAAYVAAVPREARVIFPRLPEGDPDAAWLHVDDPDVARIRRAVAQGYLVYTRADAGTEEARANDGRRRDRAFASGAQLIATDYPYADTRFSAYSVRFAGYRYSRCAAAWSGDACEDALAEGRRPSR